MSKWKNPVVIRLERGINENHNNYVVLQRVHYDYGVNQYRFVDSFDSFEAAMKKRHEILERLYEKQPKRKKTA